MWSILNKLLPARIMDLIPFGMDFVNVFIILVICYKVSSIIGRKHGAAQKYSEQLGSAISMSSTLNLIALVLAFTFAMAVALFNQRKELVVLEANTISTAYLRTDYLPKPHGKKLAQLLEEYVKARVNLLRDNKIDELLIVSDRLHKKMWSNVVPLAKKNPNSVTLALFIEQLNDLIDLHSKRVEVGLHSRIPWALWVCLYLLTLLAMCSLGYQRGYEGKERQRAPYILIFSISLVLHVISDLDQPSRGLIQGSQKVTADLLKLFS